MMWVGIIAGAIVLFLMVLISLYIGYALGLANSGSDDEI